MCDGPRAALLEHRHCLPAAPATPSLRPAVLEELRAGLGRGPQQAADSLSSEWSWVGLTPLRRELCSFSGPFRTHICDPACVSTGEQSGFEQQHAVHLGTGRASLRDDRAWRGQAWESPL